MNKCPDCGWPTENVGSCNVCLSSDLPWLGDPERDDGEIELAVEGYDA